MEYWVNAVTEKSIPASTKAASVGRSFETNGDGSA